MELLKEKIKSKPGLKNFYFNRSEEVKDYFSYLPQLINNGFPLNICLAYCFYRVEVAHNQCIYCGIVKLHKADAGFTRRIVDEWDMYRGDFSEKFELIYGYKRPLRLTEGIQEAASVRDDVMHGSTKTPSDKREAIGITLRYAEAFNSFVDDKAGLRPFTDDLRGFKGRASSVDKNTTRWILKGMGFNVG